VRLPPSGRSFGPEGIEPARPSLQPDLAAVSRPGRRDPRRQTLPGTTVLPERLYVLAFNEHEPRCTLAAFYPTPPANCRSSRPATSLSPSRACFHDMPVPRCIATPRPLRTAHARSAQRGPASQLGLFSSSAASRFSPSAGCLRLGAVSVIRCRCSSRGTEAVVVETSQSPGSPAGDLRNRVSQPSGTADAGRVSVRFSRIAAPPSLPDARTV